MKASAVVLPLLAITVAITSFARQIEPSDELASLRNLDSFVKVTEQPFEMDDKTARLCRPPRQQPENPHEPNYPAKAFCNVYVSPAAKEIMLSGKGTYPEGSLVIKSKLATAKAETPELLTVMQKMPAGYDVQHGDWKYLIVEGSTLKQLAAGRIDSCQSCHDQYAETDFVTRLYLKGKQSSK